MLQINSANDFQFFPDITLVNVCRVKYKEIRGDFREVIKAGAIPKQEKTTAPYGEVAMGQSGRIIDMIRK